MNIMNFTILSLSRTSSGIRRHNCDVTAAWLILVVITINCFVHPSVLGSKINAADEYLELLTLSLAKFPTAVCRQTSVSAKCYKDSRSYLSAFIQQKEWAVLSTIVAYILDDK